MRVDADVALKVYERLLAGEPDAPNDLIELFLQPLIRALEKKYYNLSDPFLITDMVTDALFQLVQQPQRYQPARGSLWNYLYMDAYGDLRNAVAREGKRQAKIVPFELVAHDQPARNDTVDEAINRQLLARLPAGMTPVQLMAELRQERNDPREWQVVELMLNGTRPTAPYAEVLGIGDQPVTEQRRLVKQAKDRLRVWLKRRGIQIDG